jgi:hypothetical protein
MGDDRAGAIADIGHDNTRACNTRACNIGEAVTWARR